MSVLYNTVEMDSKIVVLHARTRIDRAVKRIAQQIERDTVPGSMLCLVPVLTGSIVFCSQLVQHLKCPLRIFPVMMTSYLGTSTTAITMPKLLCPLPSITGQDVVIVDDIVETGRQLRSLIGAFKQAKAARVRVATLVTKWHEEREMRGPDIDYSALTAARNQFVIGYGMDFNGLYRNLPYIGYIPQSSH